MKLSNYCNNIFNAHTQINHLGCRIYVGNLSWEVKWQDLKDLFKPCGTVVRADVMEEPGGRSKGSDVLHFLFICLVIHLIG